MKILWVRHIDGPNVYIYKPILVARIDLEALSERESFEYPGFADRLLRAFPGLREHHCAKGAPGGFVERLYGGTYFGHIVEHLAIELASCTGLDVHYGKTLYAGDLGQYEIVMECTAFECQKTLLYRAVELVQALLGGAPFDVQSILNEARHIYQRTQLGPSTQAIVNAALRRNIPVRRLSDRSLIQLGFGRHRKLVEATVTAHTSAVSVDIACDKELTKRILTEAGIPVPEGGVAESREEVIAVSRQLGYPVVTKPFNGNQGRGVSLNLRTEAELAEGYRIASQYSNRVIVERFLDGRNVRLLVIDGRFAAASERLPARVTGNGVQTIEQLIAAANADPMRGNGHEKPLTKIVIDPVVVNTLRRQQLSLDDIPAPGQIVYVRDSANLSTGGEAIDITDELHVSYKMLAERAARIIGLDVCGIDMVVPSVNHPCEAGQCAVIEVNAAPGIRMHQHPSYGLPRDAGEAIVGTLFPGGENGRIPIVSITGTNGKTTTTRLIGHALAMTGKCVGMTTTGGVYIGGNLVVAGDTTGPASARIVLGDPVVDVAVLETARGGIVRGGLAYDQASVAVLTNITVDHVGQDGVESLEDLLHIKSLVAECVNEEGTVVLNADDPNLVQLSKRLTARVIFFSASENNAILKRHLACGGVGYYLSRGWLVEGRGNLTWDIALAREIPLTLSGTAQFQIENCLAAAAALRALGLTRMQVATALTAFLPSRDNPGRCMIYQMPSGGHVVLDYGHNPDGFGKVGRWLAQTSRRRLLGVVGVPGDRADHVIRRSADELSQIFDCFFVKEDSDKRGRAVGEVAQIISEQISLRHPEKPCVTVLSETEALEQSIMHLEAGDVAVMFYEKLEPADQLVRQMGGVPVHTLGAYQMEADFALTL